MLARLNTTPLHLRLLIGFGLVLALSAAQSIFAYRTAAERVDADHAQLRNEAIVKVAQRSADGAARDGGGVSGLPVVW